MIQYRPFLNCDPPALLQIWREQPPERGLMQPISNLLLEMFVLSKPYFDRDGLVVADDEGEVVGFAHAGFGPTKDRCEISTEVGVICMLAVARHEQQSEIMHRLLEECEGYLIQRGSHELRVGSTFPLSPFYLGLHGGSDLPGVPKSDVDLQRLLEDHDYQAIEDAVAFERDLRRFRPPVDRQLLQHRRQYRLIPHVNPNQLTWWDACVFGLSDRIQFVLAPKSSDEYCGEINFWDMGPLATRPFSAGMGLIHLSVVKPLRRQGLGLFMAAESLKYLERSGIERIETQTAGHNEAGQKLLGKLGFERLREGTLFRKLLS